MLCAIGRLSAPWCWARVVVVVVLMALPDAGVARRDGDAVTGASRCPCWLRVRCVPCRASQRKKPSRGSYGDGFSLTQHTVHQKVGTDGAWTRFDVGRHGDVVEVEVMRARRRDRRRMADVSATVQ